jgi:hypothetical protein
MGFSWIFFDFVATYFQTHPSQLKNISHHAASGAPHPVESRNVASEMARSLPRNWWSIETLVTSAIILRHLLNHALKLGAKLEVLGTYTKKVVIVCNRFISFLETVSKCI